MIDQAEAQALGDGALQPLDLLVTELDDFPRTHDRLTLADIFPDATDIRPPDGVSDKDMILRDEPDFLNLDYRISTIRNYSPCHDPDR